MKRVIFASAGSSRYNLSTTSFVSRKDKKYYTSIVEYLYNIAHWPVTRTFKMMHTYKVNGEFTGMQDAVPYVVLKEDREGQRVINRRYFDSQYAPIDDTKLEKYLEIRSKFFSERKKSGIYTSDIAVEDIVQWLADNNITDFSALA